MAWAMLTTAFLPRALLEALCSDLASSTSSSGLSSDGGIHSPLPLQVPHGSGPGTQFSPAALPPDPHCLHLSCITNAWGEGGLLCYILAVLIVFISIDR